MGKIGNGYGSEYQLGRYLGERPIELARVVASAISATNVAFVSPLLTPTDGREREWKGVGFAAADGKLAKAFRDFWPSTGNAPNWDLVGLSQQMSNTEWLLFEAKAHVGEMKRSCGAVAHGGLPMIEQALGRVKQALSVDPSTNWLRNHYQYANRLATLYFLREQGVAARLIYIYFTGDCSPSPAVCPKEPSGWKDALDEQASALGLPPRHVLSDQVHKIFLPVLPAIQSV